MRGIGRMAAAAAAIVVLAGVGYGGVAGAAPAGVGVSGPADPVDCYDAAELVVRVDRPDAANPFTDVRVTAEVTPPPAPGGQTAAGAPVKVDGFCDAVDGGVFRVRFMPARPGEHRYRVTFQQGEFRRQIDGTFAARASARPGPVRVDPKHPFHFVREGTGRHWFWNATTTYYLLAWDEPTIARSVDRLADLGVNRIRVALCGRTKDGRRWNEPLVHPTERFEFRLEPWPAARPANVEDPGYDVSRFNLDLFRRAERTVRRARDRDVVVSLIFYVDGRDAGVDPFGKAGMGGPDERRYYQYVIARLGAFANVTWDVANEYRLFRDDPWVERMGAWVRECDPYGHLTGTHGHGDFRFRTSAWADFASYQKWDEAGGYAFMLKNRRDQAATGRPMPQANEEYGYEDHYPTGWGGKRVWPARNADTRRRIAWEISMAGCYQSTGERANDGTGAGPDTGGGWVNGRGNEQMTMLLAYRHMARFFTSFDWWALEPHDDLAGPGTLVLADPGRCYVAYVGGTGVGRAGAAAMATLAPGTYRARWYNCRTGDWADLPDVKQAAPGPWTSPATPDAGDWAALLEAK